MSALSLLIDLGNTRLKWVLATDGELVNAPSAIAWPGIDLPWAEWHAAGVAQIVLASVAGTSMTARLIDAIRDRMNVPLRQAKTQSQWLGLTGAYPMPERLGVDRWLGLIPAYRSNPGQRCLVVSAGTALTVDVLDPGGQHRGGLIAPGLAAMREGLIAAAPALAAYREGEANVGMAIDSADAIASGCLQAALGLIERHRGVGEGQPPSMLLLSGGDAAMLAPHVRPPHVLRPWLVLEGLAAWVHVANGGIAASPV